MSLEQKYLKYKSKYLKLKEQLGGECNPIPKEDYTDPINLENLLDRNPEYRITVNGRCYDIRDIYTWTIELGKPFDPLKNPVSPIDRQRIIDTFNNIPLTVEEE